MKRVGERHRRHQPCASLQYSLSKQERAKEHEKDKESCEHKLSASFTRFFTAHARQHKLQSIHTSPSLLGPSYSAVLLELCNFKSLSLLKLSFKEVFIENMFIYLFKRDYLLAYTSMKTK